jgi:hypothetical protein
VVAEDPSISECPSVLIAEERRDRRGHAGGSKDGIDECDAGVLRQMIIGVAVVLSAPHFGVLAHSPILFGIHIDVARGYMSARHKILEKTVGQIIRSINLAIVGIHKIPTGQPSCPNCWKIGICVQFIERGYAGPTEFDECVPSRRGVISK